MSMSEHPARTPLREIALASQSPRRRLLLEGLGLHVAVVASAYAEEDNAPQGVSPRDVALAHAAGKAREAERSGPPVLVAADTIVVVDGELLGKPRGNDEAAAMLRRLSGREHVVHTGFVVLDRSQRRSVSGVESTTVRFARLRDEQIAAYVATGDPLDKAGAYGIQGLGGLFVSSISGDFYTVMGLPLARIGDALAELGYDVFAR
jgi:nucleoside triphosphate pyrophosphatase